MTMNTLPSLQADRALQDERNRLRERALEQANALRDEALSAFWRGTASWLGETVTGTRRSADRLAARLRQHAKLRGAPSGSGSLGR